MSGCGSQPVDLVDDTDDEELIDSYIRRVNASCTQDDQLRIRSKCAASALQRHSLATHSSRHQSKHSLPAHSSRHNTEYITIDLDDDDDDDRSKVNLQ